jgi:hypothetical protein
LTSKRKITKRTQKNALALPKTPIPRKKRTQTYPRNRSSIGKKRGFRGHRETKHGKTPKGRAACFAIPNSPFAIPLHVALRHPQNANDRRHAQTPSLPQAGTHGSTGCPRVQGRPVETTGPPRFLGDSTHVPCSQTPTEPRRQATTTPRCSLPPFVRRRLPQLGSYVAQSHGPCIRCLRFAGRITPPRRQTRFWLLARLCRVGLVTRRVPTKGFHMSDHLTSSFPRLAWRKPD